VRWWRTSPPPPAHVSSEGEGGEVVEDKTTPSGLRFEQGRDGGGWGQETAPPIRVSSEGGVGGQDHPRRLAFRTREGWGLGLGQETAPPTRVLSEGGVGWWWWTRPPPPACVSSKGEVGGGWGQRRPL